jgi:hypothetical protein
MRVVPGMREPQDPSHVPDLDVVVDAPIDVSAGFDTDGDGRPDTVLDTDGIDLVVAIDLEGDRFADQVLRIGPDAVVREVAAADAPGWGEVDGLIGGAEVSES